MIFIDRVITCNFHANAPVCTRESIAVKLNFIFRIDIETAETRVINVTSTGYQP